MKNLPVIIGPSSFMATQVRGHKGHEHLTTIQLDTNDLKQAELELGMTIGSAVVLPLGTLSVHAIDRDNRWVVLE